MKNRLSFQILIFVLVRMVIHTTTRMVYPFLPVFGRGLGVGFEQLSLAITVRSVSGAFGPFLASLADSRGRKTGILLGLALFICGILLMVLWPGYPAFVATLALTILGNYVFIPSMQAYLGDCVPYQRRGLALSITEYGWSLSFILGMPFIGFLIARFGWQAPFAVLAVLAVLGLLVLAWMLPGGQSLPGEQPRLWQNFRNVFTSPAALAGIGFGAAVSASNELVNLVFGVWLEDTFQVKIAALAVASVIIGLSELGGEGLVSLFTDRIGKRRAVLIGVITNSLAAACLLALGGSLAGALFGLFLIYLTFEFTIVSSIPLMTEILPKARATLMATFIAGLSLGRAAGAMLSAPLYQAGRNQDAPGSILFIVLGAVLINLASLAALHHLNESPEAC